jgi:hypothetical protein
MSLSHSAVTFWLALASCDRASHLHRVCVCMRYVYIYMCVLMCVGNKSEYIHTHLSCSCSFASFALSTALSMSPAVSLYFLRRSSCVCVWCVVCVCDVRVCVCDVCDVRVCVVFEKVYVYMWTQVCVTEKIRAVSV